MIFDLEDAVAPDRKADARESVHTVLSDPDFDPACEVIVRVNPVGIDADADLSVLLDGSVRLDAFLLPMVDSAEDVRTFTRLLTEHGTDLPVLPAVETATGVLNAPSIAASETADAIVLGAEDFAASIGATRTKDGREIGHARDRLLMAAKAAGVEAIDTVFTDIDDREGLAREARFVVGLGFDGKAAIHPTQVDPINAAFTPDDDAIEWARKVLTAREAAADQGRGVFTVDEEMVDPPLIARAERIAARARAAGIEIDG